MKKAESLVKYERDSVEARILTIRGERVLLDADLASIYGVEIRVLNQQVQRNPSRFPPDFSFVLTAEEWAAVKSIRSQNVILKRGQHRKYLPRTFTEHGAIMAANVLNSPRAIEMGVFVVRAFVRMRAALTDTAALARKLAVLEREVKARLDSHDSAIVDILRRFMELIDPPPQTDPPRKAIGFGVQEKAMRYGARNKRRPNPEP
jgi:hypothetical protein